MWHNHENEIAEKTEKKNSFIGDISYTSHLIFSVLSDLLSSGENDYHL